MPAYVIAAYDVEDADQYEPYVPGVRPLLEKHGARILAADYQAEVLEGDKRTVYVVLEFDSREAALGWYHDPAYLPLKKIRLGSCAKTSLVLAKGFVAPDSAE